jgi:hypothetical protein
MRCQNPVGAQRYEHACDSHSLLINDPPPIYERRMQLCSIFGSTDCTFHHLCVNADMLSCGESYARCTCVWRYKVVRSLYDCDRSQILRQNATCRVMLDMPFFNMKRAPQVVYKHPSCARCNALETLHAHDGLSRVAVGPCPAPSDPSSLVPESISTHVEAPAFLSYIHHRYPLMCNYWVGTFHSYDLAASLNPSGFDNFGSCSDRPFPGLCSQVLPVYGAWTS